jgi:hypothetical protein
MRKKPCVPCGVIQMHSLSLSNTFSAKVVLLSVIFQLRFLNLKVMFFFLLITVNVIFPWLNKTFTEWNVNKQNKLSGLNPLSNYADRAAATCLRYRVPRGQRDGSLRPYSHFSRPELLLILPSSSSFVLTRLSGLRSRSTTSQKNLIEESNPDLWICSQYFWALDHRGSQRKYSVSERSWFSNSLNIRSFMCTCISEM